MARAHTGQIIVWSLASKKCLSEKDSCSGRNITLSQVPPQEYASPPVSAPIKANEVEKKTCLGGRVYRPRKEINHSYHFIKPLL